MTSLRVSSAMMTAPVSDLLKPLAFTCPRLMRGQGQAVRQKRAELLHQVQGQPGATGSITVKKAHRRIESHGFQSRSDVVQQQCVKKRKQAVDIVQWRAPISPIESKTRPSDSL